MKGKMFKKKIKRLIKKQKEEIKGARTYALHKQTDFSHLTAESESQNVILTDFKE